MAGDLGGGRDARGGARRICVLVLSERLARGRRAWLAPGTPVPEAAIDRLQSAANHAGNTWCRVPAGVWHPTLEAEESVIVSDQFELAIFLVRYPEARVVVHDEETETDAFDVMTDSSRGFDGSR